MVVGLPIRVFVYGTLKKGQPNEHIMRDPQTGSHTFVSSGTMVESYPLIVATKFNIPFLLPQKGEGKRVHGELYEVDEVKLADLDVLEGYPEFYSRDIHPIEMPDGKIVDAWVYMLRNYDDRFAATQTDFIDCYKDGINDRFYVRHEKCASNDDCF